MTINEYIRYLRQSKHITQEQLAKDIGISIETIRKLEQGKTAQPHLYTLVALENYFDLPQDTLVEYKEKTII